MAASRVRPFFRDDPMAGDYQDYVGGKYQVLEMSGFFISKRAVQRVSGWRNDSLRRQLDPHIALATLDENDWARGNDCALQPGAGRH